MRGEDELMEVAALVQDLIAASPVVDTSKVSAAMETTHNTEYCVSPLLASALLC